MCDEAGQLCIELKGAKFVLLADGPCGAALGSDASVRERQVNGYTFCSSIQLA